MTTLNNKPVDIDIASITGLETYKGLYYFYPNIYSYISDPLQPTEYFKSLVSGVILNSGLTFDEAGIQIYENLSAIAKGLEPNNYRMVEPLIDSSYPIKYLNRTFTENAILITLVLFLSFWILWYLYKVGFFQYLFNNYDGIACYNCSSIFDII
jgi:hypothetical protein